MRIPCLMITYGRLAYTKIALEALNKSDVSSILVWDNGSTDGTQEWLKEYSVGKPKISLHLHPINEGIKEAMNYFIKTTNHYYLIAKVDNDTVVPKDFCRRMLLHMAKADLVQARHKIIEATCPGGWDAFTKNMKKDGDLFFNTFVGGSGILMKRSVLSELPATDWVLYSWMQWQRNNPKVKKAFANDVEIKLLDEHGYTDYPDYYKETKRL